MPLLQGPEFLSAKAIIIEEAQFFNDLKVFVLTAVEQFKKDVVVVGLDGDSNRKPFGQILELIPYCDSVQKLTAVCTKCENGVRAIFTSRKVHADSQVLVGAADLYEPLCRRHYCQ
jgi:thymidine kinase